MGWDAYAVPFNGLRIRQKKVDGTPNQVGDEDYEFPDGDPEYIVAEVRVKGQGLIADWLLRHGGLDVSTCGQMLARATGFSVYGEDWTSEQVQGLSKSADWNFEINEEDEWAKESARAFLERSAELGRGIRFSW
jgi:hypothetical protein